MATKKQHLLPASVRKSLITLKAGIIERCLKGELAWKQGAALLNMAPKSLSRLKRRYLNFGPEALLPQTPGPRSGNIPSNRTPSLVEKLVFHLAVKYKGVFGSGRLARMLEKEHGVKLNQSTIWRILKRRKTRG